MSTMDRMSQILPDVTEAIGSTPVVRINRVSKDLECELVAKLEFMNPGGSVKDRIGREMVNRAIADGILKEGDTVVEPTSGNTGIGLSMTCAAKGFKSIMTLPEKMSNEKVYTLTALGSKVYRTPTEAAFDDPGSHIGVANKLQKENSSTYHILDQYSNPANPDAHTRTAEEIIQQCGGKLDMVVIGAGTGGTVSGVAKVLKKKMPHVQIVAVDPDGSLLHDPENAKVHTYDVEGIGYDFVPKVLDRSLVDKWEVTKDKEAFLMARRLIREEGLLCGGSSGTAMVGALRAAKSLKKGQRCLVILPDSIRNYMTKFLSDDWMVQRGYLDKRTDETQVITTRPGAPKFGTPAQPKRDGKNNVLVGLAIGVVLGALFASAVKK